MDVFVANSETKCLKEAMDEMLKLKGHTCCQIVHKQKKITMLETESSTLSKVLPIPCLWFLFLFLLMIHILDNSCMSMLIIKAELCKCCLDRHHNRNFTTLRKFLISSIDLLNLQTIELLQKEKVSLLAKIKEKR